MSLPIDRTSKTALDANLSNGITSDAPVIKANNDVLYNGNDELYNYVLGLIAGGTLQHYPFALNRQAIINGNLDLWQRNTSFTNIVDASYTADRYQASITNTGTLPTTITHSKLTLTPDDIPGSYFGYRINVNGAGSGFGASDQYSLRQKIEFGTRYLCGAGKKVTVSFKAKSDIAGKRIGLFAVQSYGSGGSPNASENISGKIVTLTTSWQTFSFTFTTNTLVGKTFGSNNDDFLVLGIAHMWGASFATAVLGGGTAETFGASGNIDIAQVQVNAGDQILPFQPRSYREEENLCLRYYEKFGMGSTGMWWSTTQAKMYGIFRTPKRVTPTLTILSVTPSIEDPGVADRTAAAATFTDGGTNASGFVTFVNGFTGAVALHQAFSRADFGGADSEL